MSSSGAYHTLPPALCKLANTFVRRPSSPPLSGLFAVQGEYVYTAREPHGQEARVSSEQNGDGGQYSPAAIHKYETIYGRNFVSPGGAATTRELLALAGLQAGAQVLDVGCGLGGAAFLMAQEYGAHVHGIDIEPAMLAIARERCAEAGLEESVRFSQGNILEFSGAEQYDLAHSRDAFLHIHAKPQLFAVLWRALRPGGRLLFTDYMRRDAGEASAAFAAYVRGRGYDLYSLAGYRAALEAAGFGILRAEDRTAEFIDILERELAALEASELSAAERADLAESWRSKLAHARAGDHRWGVLLAEKPTNDH